MELGSQSRRDIAEQRDGPGEDEVGTALDSGVLLSNSSHSTAQVRDALATLVLKPAKNQVRSQRGRFTPTVAPSAVKPTLWANAEHTASHDTATGQRRPLQKTEGSKPGSCPSRRNRCILGRKQRKGSYVRQSVIRIIFIKLMTDDHVPPPLQSFDFLAFA